MPLTSWILSPSGANALTSTSIAATVKTGFSLDFRTTAGGKVFLQVNPSTAAVTSYLLVNIYRGVGTAGSQESDPYIRRYLYYATPPDTTYPSSVFDLPPGIYQFEMTNTDPSIAVTVEAAYDVLMYTS